MLIVFEGYDMLLMRMGCGDDRVEGYRDAWRCGALCMIEVVCVAGVRECLRGLPRRGCVFDAC